MFRKKKRKPQPEPPKKRISELSPDRRAVTELIIKYLLAADPSISAGLDKHGIYGEALIETVEELVDLGLVKIGRDVIADVFFFTSWTGNGYEQIGKSVPGKIMFGEGWNPR